MAIGKVEFMHQCGTHAHMYSRTLAHLNSKLEIKQKKRGGRQGEKSENEKKYSWHEKNRSPDGPAVARAYHPPGVATPSKQWMDHLTNLTYCYNPSTTPREGGGVSW